MEDIIKWLNNKPFWFETEYTNQPNLPEMIDKPQKDIFINKKDVPVIPMEDKQVEISYYYHDFWK